MGVYTIETPDGRKLDIEADDEKAAIAGAQDWVRQNPTEAQKADAAVRAADTGSLGDRFERFSNQVMDPFHLRDEIAGGGAYLRGLVMSGGSLDAAAKEYSDAAEKVRAEQRYAREKNTILPELAGGLATVNPGTVATVAPSLARGLAQSAKAGAGYGAIAGAADASGGVTDRAAGAIEGGLTGTVAGPIASHVIVPIAGRGIGLVRDAARYGANAVRSANNPTQAAVENVADRMLDSGLDPATVRAQISPPPSANLAGRVNPQSGAAYNAADMADIISRAARGDTHAAIAADYGIHPDTVSRYVRTYQDNNPTPLNLIDLAKEAAGEGGASPLTRLGRASYSLAGDEAGQSAQNLLGRQAVQSGRVSNIVQRSTAGGDFEATRAAGLENLRNEANQAYRQFYAEPDLATDQLTDLLQDPVFRNATIQAQQQARVAAIRRNQNGIRQANATGQPFTPEPVPTVEADNQVFSPEMLDKIQRQLRITSEGVASNPNAARHASDLRQVFLDRIEDHYPTFRDIRRNYATGLGEFGEEGALEAGANLTTKLGAPAREALRGFDDMTPAQQDLFRLGFGRKLMDMAANPQVGGAVANQFNTPAVRDIVERLFPRNNAALWGQGQQLLQSLRREAITTQTTADVLKGARTAELNSDMQRLLEPLQAAADVATLNYAGLWRKLQTRLTTQMGRQGAAETMRILTETNPAELLPLLNRLEQAAQTSGARRQLVTDARALRATNVPSVGAVGGFEGERLRELIFGR